MAQNRLSVLVALILAAPLCASAADVTGRTAPITVINVPGGIATPTLSAPALSTLPGLSPLGTIPALPMSVSDGIPQLPALAQAPEAIAQAPIISGPAPIAGAALATPAARAQISSPAAAIGSPAAAIAPGSSAFKRDSIADQLGRQDAEIGQAIGKDDSGLSGKEGLDSLYEFGRHGKGRGGRGWVNLRDEQDRRQGKRGGFDASQDTVFVVNDEGIQINGRAAAYYKEVRRMVDKYQGRLNLSESLDVMDDTYADVWSKLATIEAVAKAKGIERHNTHLEETLVWVDGTMTDAQGRHIAVHTHRVYFHHSKSAQSEIAEGIRRVDRYIDDSMKNFGRGGKAEQALGPLDEVVLAFDTRGYSQIKDHLKAKEKELAKTYGPRYRFVYVDELAQIPQTKEAVRSELNKLVKKYKGKGLQKIIEGVIYSRYVGVLLELKTVEHYLDAGYTIEQSGRDLFDANNQYITELDAVVRSPEGKLTVVEAKSARVKLPNEEALADKVLYKLDCYLKNRATMEKALGGPFDVTFSFDVGSNVALADYLKSQEEALSKKYGFAVSFIFIDSSPEQDPGAPQARSGGRR